MVKIDSKNSHMGNLSLLLKDCQLELHGERECL